MPITYPFFTSEMMRMAAGGAGEIARGEDFSRGFAVP
jgi:hypothetical protein